MPSLIDLRRRVRSVKNTQQITKAMKMVAASKLRRAQQRIINARPFALQAQRVLKSVTERVDADLHPLLAVRPRTPESRTLVIVVTGDKGLCGGFNTNVIKAAATFVLDSGERCELGLVGRKGRDYFTRRGFAVAFEQVNLFQTLKFQDALDSASHAVDGFVSGEYDRVILIYNEFKSVISQRVVVDQLLPLTREAATGADPEYAGGGLATMAPGSQIEHLYEPSARDIFETLLPRYVEVQIYRALLESNAAFFAAQMTAMDTAVKNATDMIASLTLYMNKVRQAAITREIIEVVSGAEAL
jgi:F-type H+-transporting ATPase subunit gamma